MGLMAVAIALVFMRETKPLAGVPTSDQAQLRSGQVRLWDTIVDAAWRGRKDAA